VTKSMVWHGLEPDEYVNYCFKDGKSYRGEVHKIENESEVEEKKNPRAGVRNRGKCVFQSTHPKVKDDKDHFPINNAGQARNALARANQYKKAPAWYSGSLQSLKKAVARAVKAKYPSIKVTKAATESVIDEELKDLSQYVDFEDGQLILVASLADEPLAEEGEKFTFSKGGVQYTAVVGSPLESGMGDYEIIDIQPPLRLGNQGTATESVINELTTWEDMGWADIFLSGIIRLSLWLMVHSCLLVITLSMLILEMNGSWLILLVRLCL